jgi:hypothetical protein
MKKYSFFLCLLLFLFLSQASLFPQSAFREGIKFGLEFKDYMAGKSGHFINTPGFEFGLYTGIDLYGTDINALSLKVELNIVNLISYKLKQVLTLNSWENNYVPVYVIADEKISCPFIELGFIPEYFFIFNDNTMASLFLGPSIGLGIQGNEYSQLNNNSEGPAAPTIIAPFSLNTGVNFYYKKLFTGIKYRYCYIRNADINEFNKITLLVGLAFN